MSRCITFCVLAAAAALIASPASADRECFENSCRMPNAVEPPARATTAPVAGIEALARLDAVADANATSATAARFARARKAHRIARHARARYLRTHRPAYVVNQYPVAAENLFVGVPGTIYPDGNMVPRYPYLQDDPSWRLCQTEERQGRHRTYECGPYSYHPFGVYGHRPNGTYVETRSAPSYVLAPSAKVIRIERED
jgi:hypothetical protein